MKHYRRLSRSVVVATCAAVGMAWHAGQAKGCQSLVPVPLPLSAVVITEPLATDSAIATFSTASAHGQESSPSPADRMIWQLNQYRAQQNNLPPPKANPALMKAAQDYAVRLAIGDFFGHDDPDFGCNGPADRAVAAGYTGWTIIGENLAAGYDTPEFALEALKRSPGHNAAMLDSRFREVGVGYYFQADDAANVRRDGNCPYVNRGGPYRHYWVQMFGARASDGLPVLPIVINGEAISTTQRQVMVYIHGSSTLVQRMRFSSDGATWSAYEPYTATKLYDLPAGTGLKTVYVELTMNSGVTQVASDTIYLQDGAFRRVPSSPSSGDKPDALTAHAYNVGRTWTSINSGPTFSARTWTVCATPGEN